jgi:7-cyano-7-deazaguanine reductase
LPSRAGAWQRFRVATTPTRALETFANPRPGRRYEVRFECPEFTCLCPKTGQPDFATKLYLWSFRDEGAFHEDVTNRILDDLVAALRPRELVVEGDFLVRGGIHTVVEVRWPDSGNPGAGS